MPIAIGVGTSVSTQANVLGAAAAFSPLDLSPALWLDASDSGSITLNTTTVSQWNDKSGNARHFTQGTGTAQPTYTSAGQNGLNVVTFDGTSDFMSAGDTLDLGTNSISVFLVAKLSAAANQTIIGKYKASPLSGSWLILRETSEMGSVYYNGASQRANSTGGNATTCTLYGFICDRAAGSITQRIDRATNGTAAFAADNGSSRDIATQLYMGALRNSSETGNTANYYLVGYICEVVVCLSALNSTDRDNLESYLRTKWGTA